MSLIDSSYFHTGRYRIDNVAGDHPAVESIVADVTKCIAENEPEYLTLIMGEVMYDEFIAGLAENPIPAKWSALKNKLVDTTNKISPIAAYVWNRYTDERESQNSAMGQLQSKAENATVVSSRHKLVKSWNESMNAAIDLIEWLNEPDQLTTYPTQAPEFDDIVFDNIFGI